MIGRVVQAGGRKVGGRCQWQVQGVPLGEGEGRWVFMHQGITHVHTLNCHAIIKFYPHLPLMC